MSDIQNQVSHSAATEPTAMAQAGNTVPTATEHVGTDGPLGYPALKPEAALAADSPSESITTEPVEARHGKDAGAATSEPIHSGALGYKAPGLMKSFKFSKRYFWLGDEPVKEQHLSYYLRGEKPEVAHPIVAWASQTGKGLLYFAKHADGKNNPTSVINLSEVSGIVKEGEGHFSFKLHGHKHTFQAGSATDRDGWVAAIEKAAQEAKASREHILSSTGYKDSISHLGKPAALAEGAAARRESTSSSSSSDAQGLGGKKKSKSKSRSVSRGKRASIFGSLLGKKDEPEVKKNGKVEETTLAKDTLAKGEKNVVAADVKQGDAPIIAGTAAPLDPTVVAARVLSAQVDSEPAVTSEATTAAVTESATEPFGTTRATAPKPTKRNSVFNAFFEKVRSPTTEKKEHDFAPTVPSKDADMKPAVTHLPGRDGATDATATGLTEGSTTAAPVAATAAITGATTPRKDKENFFGRFMSSQRAKSPATATRETAPSTETTLAEQKIDEPITATTVPTTATTANLEAPAATSTAATATTPDAGKDKRRSSFFGSFGGTMRRSSKPDIAPEGEAVEGESRANTTSPLGGKLGGLFRNPSKTLRGNKEAKKETVTPAALTETTETATTGTSMPSEHTGLNCAGHATSTSAVEPQHDTSIADAVNNAATVGHTTQSQPAIHSSV
ncbi:hypothetical protein LTR04_001649 [Oleoguttula sp. CCFEE 6159]|nr:hypothetical protein LTR04_001649 [Oleoguttula sp. CCFEE 6159]